MRGSATVETQPAGAATHHPNLLSGFLAGKGVGSMKSHDLRDTACRIRHDWQIGTLSGESCILFRIILHSERKGQHQMFLQQAEHGPIRKSFLGQTCQKITVYRGPAVLDIVVREGKQWNDTITLYQEESQLDAAIRVVERVHAPCLEWKFRRSIPILAINVLT